MLQVSEILKEVVNGSPELRVPRGNSARYLNSMPPVTVWNVNNSCNMTCPHCYASAKLNPIYNGVSEKEALKILSRLTESGIKMIIFSGGEPLMREDLFTLIETADGAGISCCLSSNGTLLTADKAKHMKELGVAYVGISIDGLKEFNDSYRGLENGYELAWTGVLNAMECGIPTGIRITVSKKNIGEVFPLMELAAERSVPRFYLSHLVYGGRGKGYAAYDLEPPSVRKFMKKVFNRALLLIEQDSPLSIVTGGNDADGVFLLLFIRERFGREKANEAFRLLKMRGGNSAGEKIINVDYKGRVHPDQFWQTSKCGNLLEQSLEEILNCSLIQELKTRSARLKGRCRECPFKGICRGSHRERALAVYGDLWAEDPACYLADAEILGSFDFIMEE